jgi:endoglucanase
VTNYARLALAACLILVAANVGCGESRHTLRISDNRLVDALGQSIRLVGVNRSGAEYACIQNLGFFDGPTDDRAIAAMVAWRINAARLPLNEDCWLAINGAPAEYSGAPYRAAVVDYVTRLHQAGLYVVLDLHWSAPGAAKATGQRPMADLDHTPSFWSSVATTFRDDQNVLFDLYNEPHDISWECWRDGCVMPGGWRAAGMQRLVDAVRATGARQPIILSGIGWANDLSAWLRYRPDDPADQLVAGFHVFDFNRCVTPTCWKEGAGAVARSVPVVTTELGQRDCSKPFLDSFMTWADSAGLSYLGWTWNLHGCKGPALISSWQGRPTPSGEALRTRSLRIQAPPIPTAVRLLFPQPK